MRCWSVEKNEPWHSISYKIPCAPSKGSDQPVHPYNLIRVFAEYYVGSQVPKASPARQQRLITLHGCAVWSAQAGLCLCSVHMKSCKKYSALARMAIAIIYLQKLIRNFLGKIMINVLNCIMYQVFCLLHFCSLTLYHIYCIDFDRQAKARV